MAKWLCRFVADYKAREFDAECCSILANFAEMVVRDVEQYTSQHHPDGAAGDLDEESQDMIRLISRNPDSCILCDPHVAGWYEPGII